MNIIASLILLTSLNFFEPEIKNVTAEEFDPTLEECQTVYDNCIATAEQEYSNGNYSYGVYLMFVDSVCPNAHLNCFFASSEN